MYTCFKNSLGVAVGIGCIVKRSPFEIVGDSERGAVGNQGEDTLVLGCRRGVVERCAALLVFGTDLTAFSYHHVHTLNVTGGGEERGGGGGGGGGG